MAHPLKSPRFLVLLLLTAIAAGSAGAAPESGSPEVTLVEGKWLIQINPNANPRAVANAVGADYVGGLAGASGYHRVRFPEQANAKAKSNARKEIAEKLKKNSNIKKFHQERKIKLYPRSYEPLDPFFSQQWHHQNTGQLDGLPFADLNVRPVWDIGYDGRGVVIGIVDTGTDYNHPDLRTNLLALGKDFISNDMDPSPELIDPVRGYESHGSAVAGITAAASNSIGGLGIAYQAKFVPIRLIGYGDGVDEFDIGDALSYNASGTIDIYNNSWGPSDDYGVRYAPIYEEGAINEALDSIEFLESTLANNVRNGRSGLGNIYVWAAGNGGLNGDNSNYDGYNSQPYTISVGAVSDDDVRSGYSEVGANLLVVAPSGGRGAGIFTTDNEGSSGYTSGNYFENFSGTSAAAPMVSGVVALMLDARPQLKWSDVQQILARTAVPVDFDDSDWQRNGADIWVSHEYGFGRVDAHAAVELSRNWNASRQLVEITRSQSMNRVLGQNQTTSGSINVNSFLEVQFVRVKVTMNHSDWGDLRIELESPSGTIRTLASPHANNNRSGYPGTWTFLSTQNLGENAQGTWRLHITDAGSSGSGSWTNWELELMGHQFSVNNSPVGDDLFFSSIDFPIQVNALSDLSDPDGDDLEILSVQNPRYGELVDLGNGLFEYTMGQTKAGTDTFSILVGDGKGGAKRRVITVANPLPVARDDVYPITSGQTINLPVLTNDRDADGDDLRIVSLRGYLSDSASIINEKSIQFNAPAGLRGRVCLQYEITDDSDGNAFGEITLIVNESPEVALTFDGEDDYMRLEPDNNLSLNDKFTMEAMIYPESYGEYVSGFGRIYDRETFIFFLNGEYPHAYYNPRSLVVYLRTTDGQTYAINTASNTIDLNTWQHVAVSYDSSDFFNPVRIYIDGESVSVNYPSGISSTRPVRPISDNRIWPLYIGESDSGARAFKGRMAEFRIWDQVLSANTIRQQHDKQLTGSEPGLRMYLPLTETLEPVAYSTGSYKGSLEIFEAQRGPKSLDSSRLDAFYTFLDQSEEGWSFNPILGWFRGESFPWVYSVRYGWLYTGHSAYSCTLQLYSPAFNWKWLQTSDIAYPWFYKSDEGKWLWYEENSERPALFYDIQASGWLPL